MSRKATSALAVVVALLVVFVLGWLWGASGKADLEAAAAAAELRMHVLETRGHVLQARVDLFDLNFGDASRHLEQARLPLLRARDRFEARRQAEAVTAADEALKHIEDAQALAAELDQGANRPAADAVRAMDRMLEEAAGPELVVR